MKTHAGLPRRSSPDGPPPPLEGLATARRLRSRRRPALASEGGFTLIEVLVALVVAVAAMTLLSQGFTTGARASTTSQFATRAALLAQRVIVDFETGRLSLGSNQSGSFEDEADFRFEATSQSGSVTGITLLTVTIRWQERNQDRSFEVMRLMKDRPSASTESSPSPTTTPTTTPK